MSVKTDENWDGAQEQLVQQFGRQTWLVLLSLLTYAMLCGLACMM